MEDEPNAKRHNHWDADFKENGYMLANNILQPTEHEILSIREWEKGMPYKQHLTRLYPFTSKHHILLCETPSQLHLKRGVQ